MTIKTRINRVAGRLRDIRGRRTKLKRQLRYRHARTLYWQARVGVRRTDYNVRKFRASRELGYDLRRTLRVTAAREKRAAAKLKALRKMRPHPPVVHTGVAYFDGKPVSAAVVPWLQRARANGWGGVLVSGYRDPYYSEQLCIHRCGRPSCPGTCAGRGSNHAILERLTVDVSDYYRFGQIMRALGAPIFNALGARDPVHFSTTGR